MSILVATYNPGKMAEYRILLRHLRVSVLFPPELDLSIDVPEDRPTYRENAVQKAVAHCCASGLVCLADDSGLEVDALDGAPGIRSARYAPGTDRERTRALLLALRDVPLGHRTARFRCVLAVAAPWGEPRCFEGVCEGTITMSRWGKGGFGYDPVFFLPEHGRTMAELPSGLKNRISHRARAVEAALPWLQDLATRGGRSVSGL